jgi:glycosyltransferase involved in cell wall biosynthesis
METLRFLFTTSFYPPYHLGGDANHVKYLASELASRGHEVHVLHSLDAYRVKRRGNPKPLHTDGVITHPIETHLSFSAYAAYLVGGSPPVERRFSALVNEINPDVVHHHNISLLGYNILAKRSNYLNLYTAHDYWLICPQNNLLHRGTRICQGENCMLCPIWFRRPPQLWRYTNAFKRAVQSIDILVAVSDYQKKRISKSLGIESVALPNFVPKPPGKIGTSAFSNFFLFGGLLEGYRGILDLIEVYVKMQEETKANLVIMGNGSLKEKLRAIVKANELEGRVSLLGWVSDDFRYRLLRDANALIISSIWPETSSLIAMESMSVGTPVIASNQGALPEIVGKLDNRLIYNSPDELRQIVLAFDKRAYSRKSTKTVYEKFFSPAVYLERYLTLIESERDRRTVCMGIPTGQKWPLRSPIGLKEGRGWRVSTKNR